MSGAVKAYRAELVGTTVYVFSNGGPGRARMATVLSAREAGYRVGPQDCRVTRYPELDGFHETPARSFQINRCHGAERFLGLMTPKGERYPT